MQTQLKRGQIFLVDLPDTGGSIQRFKRPMLIISNNLANYHSPVIHLCPISTKMSKSKLPTHVEIGMDSGLLYPSIALIEQSMLLSKDVLIRQVGECSESVMNDINRALAIQFALVKEKNKIISKKELENLIWV